MFDVVGGQRHASAALPPGKRPCTHYIGGWVWTGAENLAPTGIQSLDRPVRSESLYRLRCPDPQIVVVCLRIKQAGVKLQTGSADLWCIDQISQVGSEENIRNC